MLGSGIPAPEPSLPTFLTFRIHPELDEHSRLVVGREAAPTERKVNGVPVIEFELTPASADGPPWMKLPVGFSPAECETGGTAFSGLPCPCMLP